MKEDDRCTDNNVILCIDALRGRLLDDEELVVCVLQAFCADVPPQIEEMKRLGSLQDLEKLRRMAHKLKGAAGNIGAEMLYATLADLEAALRESPSLPYRDISSYMKRLKNDFDLLLQEIKHYL